ncbi:hypothetical protein ACH4SK_43285 [Streptomyces inhibens]
MKTVGEERIRLAGLAVEKHTWSYADWTRYYIDHPVAGVVTCSLGWE